MEFSPSTFAFLLLSFQCLSSGVHESVSTHPAPPQPPPPRSHLLMFTRYCFQLPTGWVLKNYSPGSCYRSFLGSCLPLESFSCSVCLVVGLWGVFVFDVCATFWGENIMPWVSWGRRQLVGKRPSLPHSLRKELQPHLVSLVF